MNNIRIFHAGIAVSDFDWYYDFFTRVFGMTVERTRGESPKRMLWFNEGIQLDEVAEEPAVSNLVDHLSLYAEDPIAAAHLACENGCVPTPGKGEHWFTMPNGVNIEMKPYKK